jgi:hypothetical protein
MPMGTVELREAEIAKLWIEQNPKLASEYLLRFLAEVEGWDIVVHNTKGFVRFTATAPK